MAQSSNTQRLSRRYHNAYKVGNATVNSGQAIQVMSVVLGIVVFLAVCGVLFVLPPMVGGRIGSTELLIIAAVAGIVGGGGAFTLHRIGTMIAAQGELLRAVLDVAVHTSPFLSEEQRGEIVLSPAGSSKTAGYESVLGI